VNVKLHLPDDTQLRAHGFVADGAPFAAVAWDFPAPDGCLGKGTLWGTPAILRRLAELAVQAAIQAEEEACWHARQAAARAAEGGRLA
jgi:hypothetical protein